LSDEHFAYQTKHLRLIWSFFFVNHIVLKEQIMFMFYTLLWKVLNQN